MRKPFSITLLSLLLSVTSLAQKMKVSDDNYIITFDPMYASNNLKLNSNGFDDLFLLITEKKGLKIDLLLSTLSKKNYNNQEAIVDTLKRYFKIYTIVSDGRAQTTKVNEVFFDYNNYRDAYFFSLNDTIKKYSSVTGYIIQRFSQRFKIWYQEMNAKEHTAVIRKKTSAN